MAMGTVSRPLRSKHRTSGVAYVRLTSAGAAALTVTLDEGGAINSTTVRNGLGNYTVTLTDRWKRVAAVSNIQDTTATVFSKVSAVVEGTAAANTIQIQTESGGAAADTTGKVIDLVIWLER